MLFSLQNAAQSFQWVMDRVCAGLESFLFIYLDDILVASKTACEHRHHLQLLFKCLSDYGIVINHSKCQCSKCQCSKCQFGVCSLEFLGHHISVNGITPLPSKVEFITDFSAPTYNKSLLEWLGMVRFYHSFIPNEDFA